MPTAKPRVNVAMDQGDYDLLSAFAASQGVSRASVLVELWQMAAPVMARVLKLVEEVERAKASVKKGIIEAAFEAEAKVLPLHREALLNLDMFEEAVREVLREAAGVDESGGEQRGGTPTVSAAPVEPPSSNTGVRSGGGRGVGSRRKGG